VEYVKSLKEKEAKLNEKNKQGLTPYELTMKVIFIYKMV
jgi:hypothetical protein